MKDPRKQRKRRHRIFGRKPLRKRLLKKVDADDVLEDVGCCLPSCSVIALVPVSAAGLAFRYLRSGRA